MPTITPKFVKESGQLDWSVGNHGVSISSWESDTYRGEPLPAAGDWFRVGTERWTYALILDRGEGPFEAYVTPREDDDLPAASIEYDDFLEAVRQTVRDHYGEA